MADDVKATPPAPDAFEQEEKITWDEISPSLQKRFLSLADDINKLGENYSRRFGDIRVTIGYDPPINPEMERDIWVDLNFMIVRFYMSTDMNPKTAKWYYTHAAWYGGSANDVKDLVSFQSSSKWDRVSSLVWISNIAQNNKYDPNKGMCMAKTDCYTVSNGGIFKLMDKSLLYQYSAQKVNSDGSLKPRGYIHDGGAINVKVYIVGTDVIHKEITEAQNNLNSRLDSLLSAESDKIPKDQIKQRIKYLDYYNIDSDKTDLMNYLKDTSMSNKGTVTNEINNFIKIAKENSPKKVDPARDGKLVWDKTYDSKGTYQAYDESAKAYPYTLTDRLNMGDRIYFVATSTRDPRSTDDIQIYQIADIAIYKLNFGDPTSD